MRINQVQAEMALSNMYIYALRSYETRQKLSESHKGQIPSEETLKRRSGSLREAWRLRKARSAETGA